MSGQTCWNYLALHYSEKLIVEPVSVAKSQKLRTLLDKHEVFIATPNRDQLKALTDRDDIDQACQELHERGLHNIVVHLGRDGAVISSGKGMKQISRATHSQVSDVTGAGDAAVAGLVYGLSQGYDISKSAQYGQAAASLVLRLHLINRNRSHRNGSPQHLQGPNMNKHLSDLE